MRPKPPPEFVEAAHEIGRTHDVLGCIPIVHVLCRCAGRVPLLLAGCPSQMTCPGCGRSFTLLGVSCEGVMVGTRIETREAHQLVETVQ
jgi:hypothetical protein